MDGMVVANPTLPEAFGCRNLAAVSWHQETTMPAADHR